jgi:hypothetical protein
VLKVLADLQDLKVLKEQLVLQDLQVQMVVMETKDRKVK